MRNNDVLGFRRQFWNKPAKQHRGSNRAQELWNKNESTSRGRLPANVSLSDLANSDRWIGERFVPGTRVRVKVVQFPVFWQIGK
jgi:hypothetical protein